MPHAFDNYVATADAEEFKAQIAMLAKQREKIIADVKSRMDKIADEAAVLLAPIEMNMETLHNALLRVQERTPDDAEHTLSNP